MTKGNNVGRYEEKIPNGDRVRAIRNYNKTIMNSRIKEKELITVSKNIPLKY